MTEPFEFAVGVEDALSSRRNDVFAGSFFRACNFPCGKKLGRMTILYSYKVDRDNPLGPERIVLIIGPYWRMLLFVTLPLVLLVPAACAVLLPYHHPAVIAIYCTLWLGTLLFLLATSLTDPGILPRIREQAEPGGSARASRNWVFSDQAQTYRPPGAVFDSATNLVIDGFDHTCPWTGTAIGKRNLSFFYCFVTGSQVLLYFSIFIVCLGLPSALGDFRYF